MAASHAVGHWRMRRLRSAARTAVAGAAQGGKRPLVCLAVARAGDAFWALQSTLWALQSGC